MEVVQLFSSIDIKKITQIHKILLLSFSVKVYVLNSVYLFIRTTGKMAEFRLEGKEKREHLQKI